MRWCPVCFVAHLTASPAGTVIRRPPVAHLSPHHPSRGGEAELFPGAALMWNVQEQGCYSRISLISIPGSSSYGFLTSGRLCKFYETWFPLLWNRDSHNSHLSGCCKHSMTREEKNSWHHLIAPGTKYSIFVFPP